MRATPEARAELVVFELAGQRYALRVPAVQELVRAVAVVAVPKAPPIVEGVIDVRGTVVPVLDVRARFGLPSRAAAHTDHLILAWAGERVVAIRTERVLALAAIPEDDIEDAAALVPGADYVAGVARLPDGLVLIHDLRTFLSGAETAALDQALGPRSRPGGTA